MQLLKNNELETTIFFYLKITPINDSVPTYGFTKRKINRDKTVTFTKQSIPNCNVYDKFLDRRDHGQGISEWITTTEDTMYVTMEVELI